MNICVLKHCECIDLSKKIKEQLNELVYDIDSPFVFKKYDKEQVLEKIFENLGSLNSETYVNTCVIPHISGNTNYHIYYRQCDIDDNDDNDIEYNLASQIINTHRDTMSYTNMDIVICKYDVLNNDPCIENIDKFDIINLLFGVFIKTGLIITKNGEVNEYEYISSPIDNISGNEQYRNIRHCNYKFMDMQLILHVKLDEENTVNNEIASTIAKTPVHGDVRLAMMYDDNNSVYNFASIDKNTFDKIYSLIKRGINTECEFDDKPNDNTIYKRINKMYIKQLNAQLD